MIRIIYSFQGFRGSEALCRCVVVLVEQRVEGVEDSRLALLGCGLHHVISFPAVFVIHFIEENVVGASNSLLMF